MAEDDTGAARLAGARVAEDEALIAFDLETTLRELGRVVLGPAATAADTLGVLARERPDAALLDGPATAVAEACAARGVPFALVTGYDTGAITEPALSAAPRLGKSLDAG